MQQSGVAGGPQSPNCTAPQSKRSACSRCFSRAEASGEGSACLFLSCNNGFTKDAALGSISHVPSVASGKVSMLRLAERAASFLSDFPFSSAAWFFTSSLSKNSGMFHVWAGHSPASMAGETGTSKSPWIRDAGLDFAIHYLYNYEKLRYYNG